MEREIFSRIGYHQLNTSVVADGEEGGDDLDTFNFGTAEDDAGDVDSGADDVG